MFLQLHCALGRRRSVRAPCWWRRGRAAARNFNGGAAAIVEKGDPARRINVQGDDDADEPDPFDGVVEVEVEVLAWLGLERLLVSCFSILRVGRLQVMMEDST